MKFNQFKACVDAVEHLLPALTMDQPEIRASIMRLICSTEGSDMFDTGAWNELDDAGLSGRVETWLSAGRKRLKGWSHEESTILIVEDEEAVADVMEECLSGQDRRILRAETGGQARAMMASKDIDLVILDINLPDADGRDLLAEFRAMPAHAMTPVIILTSRGTGLRAECFALGATAYLEKPFLPAALAAAVSAKLALADQINRETRTDVLTGMPNRAAFIAAFDRAAAAALRHCRPLSIGMLDLDWFKAVNDTYGHESGDAVLKHVAAQLAGSLRGEDNMARWGGEEFVALFPETDAAGARRALNKVRQALESTPVRLSDGSAISVTFSAGVTPVNPRMPIGAAIDAADTNLYRAKKEGRNRVVGPDAGQEEMP